MGGRKRRLREMWSDGLVPCLAVRDISFVCLILYQAWKIEDRKKSCRKKGKREKGGGGHNTCRIGFRDRDREGHLQGILSGTKRTVNLCSIVSCRIVRTGLTRIERSCHCVYDVMSVVV